MTVYLDRRFRSVGRIKRAAGTNHKPTIRLLNEMLSGLYHRGRLDILRSMAAWLGISKRSAEKLGLRCFYLGTRTRRYLAKHVLEYIEQKAA